MQILKYLVLLFCLPLALYAENAPDAPKRTVFFKDLFEENYLPHEIENDEGFSWIPHPRILLCSEPSSGNSWCRYALEYLTKRPSTRFFLQYRYDKRSYFALSPSYRTWFNAINPPWGIQYPDIGINFSKAPIIKRHAPRAVYQQAGMLPLIYPSKDKLILIVRDYREIYFKKTDKSPHILNVNYLDNYFELLRFFDLYPNSRKLLLYYEDLFAKPEEAFSKVLDFTEDSKRHLDRFLKELPFHQGRCSFLYNLPQHAESLGKKNFSYTKNIPKRLLCLLEKKIKESHSRLFTKYLKRYELPFEH